MTEDMGWIPLGVQEVSTQRQHSARGRFDDRYARAIREREHLWIAVVGFYVTPPITEGTLLDADAVAHGPSLGCYICEEVWTERLGHRRCTGEPKQ